MATALALSSAAAADELDWRKLSSQEKMHRAFSNTSRVCAALFGFTVLPSDTEPQMANRVYAYLLLRDHPENELVKWTKVLSPINAAISKTGEATESDDQKAAAAAVATANDPSVFDEAKARYLQGAIAPFSRALDACSLGARDPFLGKNYWTGTGSVARQEREMGDWFSEFVAEIRAPKKSK